MPTAESPTAGEAGQQYSRFRVEFHDRKHGVPVANLADSLRTDGEGSVQHQVMERLGIENVEQIVPGPASFEISLTKATTVDHVFRALMDFPTSISNVAPILA